MVTLRWRLPMMLGATIACSDPPTRPKAQQEPVLAALEAVPFEAVAPGKIIFRRARSLLGPDGTPNPPSAVYVIDGDARRSWGTLIGFDISTTAVSASPDGRRILTSHYGFVNSGAFILSPLGEGTVANGVLVASEAVHQMAWTPDSERIVFVAVLPSGVSGLYMQRAEGNAQRTLLFPTSSTNGAYKCEEALTNVHGPISVARSGAVAMTCLDSAIHILDPAAARTQPLYFSPRGEVPGRVYSPAWSPNGEEIAFIERFNAFPNATLSIRVIGRDGTGVKTVTTLGGSYSADRNETLCWMPDGNRIAFTVDDGATVSIYIVNTSGGLPIQVTSARGGMDLNLSCAT